MHYDLIDDCRGDTDGQRGGSSDPNSSNFNVQTNSAGVSVSVIIVVINHLCKHHAFEGSFNMMKMMKQLVEVLAPLAKAIKNGKNVLVHCTLACPHLEFDLVQVRSGTLYAFKRVV